MIELERQAVDDGPGVWHWIYAGLVALDGSHEGLGHPVGLRARDGRRERLQSDIAGEGSSFLGDIA